jgi:hypothetical protein
MRLDGEIVDADHPAIIDQATWTRAQALVTARPAATRGELARPRERYLLIGGMLRCGECGEALTPKTQGERDTYVCRGRQHYGADHCSQGPVSRTLIDKAVLKHFERALHDFDATVEAIASQATRHLDESRQLREQAERAAAKATENVERVKSDYTEGRIDAAEWRELRGGLMERKTATDAELERLREQEAAFDSATQPDARRETIRHLAELRQAVAGEVLATGKIETVRAAVQRIYERLVLHRGPLSLPAGLTVDDMDAIEAGDYLITMDVRDDAPIEYDAFTGALSGREALATTFSQSLVQL